MTSIGWLQIALFTIIVAATVRPLGGYMMRVFSGKPTVFGFLLGPVERGIYRLVRIDPAAEQEWYVYALALLAFNAVGLVVLYTLQRLQGLLPFNPQNFAGVDPALALNTAVSFTTNTSWQSYGGETTLSYLSQMAGITVQSFLSAATGIAVAIALIRGFARRHCSTIGNFWVDMTRVMLYVLLPICVVATLFLVWQGVPQTLAATSMRTTLDGGQQVIARGPVASQIAIKVLSGDGGGFFNANSAHPFENPTALTNLVEMLLIFVVGAALTNTFGRMVGNEAPGLGAARGDGAFSISAGVAAVYAAEADGNPAFAAFGIDQAARPNAGRRQHGGQGGPFRRRRCRRCSPRSATDSSDGAVNAMHRQLYAAGRRCAAGKHDARRGDRRRSRLGSFRHAAVRDHRGVPCRADDRPHSRICRQEDRRDRGQDDDSGDLCIPLVILGLTAIASVVAAGLAGLGNSRPARFLRDALRLHLGGDDQRQRLRRA